MQGARVKCITRDVFIRRVGYSEIHLHIQAVICHVEDTFFLTRPTVARLSHVCIITAVHVWRLQLLKITQHTLSQTNRLLCSLHPFLLDFI